MKTKTGVLTMILSVLMIVAFSSSSMAQPNTPPKMDKEAEFEPPMFKHIPNLTKEQETKMQELHKNLMKTMLPLKNELAEKQARLNTLSSAEKADMKAINACIEEIMAIKTKMMKAKMQFHQDVRALLTEEQRLQFDMHHSKMMGGKNGCGMGKGKHHGLKGNCGNGGPGSPGCNGMGPRP